MYTRGRYSSNASATIALGQDGRAIQELLSSRLDGGVGGNQPVNDFVRTPFAVRCNVVKFWRTLPADLWTGLPSVEDTSNSRRHERLALLAVLLMSVVLVAGFASLGFRTQTSNTILIHPMFGVSTQAGLEPDSLPGWYYAPSQALSLLAWTVLPSLLGWSFWRWLWVPYATQGLATRTSSLAMVRYLSGVYLYVYLMIFVGAALMFLLLVTMPVQSGSIRTCLWCFLFGESFFVPAVMWTRMVWSDSSGVVFGRRRIAGLAIWFLLFVLTPIVGMSLEVWG